MPGGREMSYEPGMAESKSAAACAGRPGTLLARDCGNNDQNEAIAKQGTTLLANLFASIVANVPAGSLRTNLHDGIFIRHRDAIETKV
jgi:hypothetical protein